MKRDRSKESWLIQVRKGFVPTLKKRAKVLLILLVIAVVGFGAEPVVTWITLKTMTIPPMFEIHANPHSFYGDIADLEDALGQGQLWADTFGCAAEKIEIHYLQPTPYNQTTGQYLNLDESRLGVISLVGDFNADELGLGHDLELSEVMLHSMAHACAGDSVLTTPFTMFFGEYGDATFTKTSGLTILSDDEGYAYNWMEEAAGQYLAMQIDSEYHLEAYSVGQELMISLLPDDKATAELVGGFLVAGDVEGMVGLLLGKPREEVTHVDTAFVVWTFTSTGIDHNILAARIDLDQVVYQYIVQFDEYRSMGTWPFEAQEPIPSQS